MIFETSGEPKTFWWGHTFKCPMLINKQINIYLIKNSLGLNTVVHLSKTYAVALSCFVSTLMTAWLLWPHNLTHLTLFNARNLGCPLIVSSYNLSQYPPFSFFLSLLFTGSIMLNDNTNNHKQKQTWRDVGVCLRGSLTFCRTAGGTSVSLV